MGESWLLKCLCWSAAEYGRIDLLTNMFLKLNLTMLYELLYSNGMLCYQASRNGQLETLKWLRNHGAKWDADTFDAARNNGHDEIIQYLRNEGFPEEDEERDESLGSEQDGSDDEDGDY